MIHVEKDDHRLCLELKQNHSGSLRRIHIILGLLLLVFVPIGFIFALIGAWPVFGFMGAELLVLYLAFRYHQKAGTAMERLTLTATSFTVERTDAQGRQQAWQFQPQWLRVELRQPSDYVAELMLSSSDRRLPIGQFLSVEEKTRVADHLTGALSRISMLQA